MIIHIEPSSKTAFMDSAYTSAEDVKFLLGFLLGAEIYDYSSSLMTSLPGNTTKLMRVYYLFHQGEAYEIWNEDGPFQSFETLLLQSLMSFK